MGRITKTEQAVNLWRSGQISSAYKLFKGFKIGFTKEERNTIITAYEINSGSAGFYKQLGIDLGQVIAEANMIIDNYCKTYNK